MGGMPGTFAPHKRWTVSAMPVPSVVSSAVSVPNEAFINGVKRVLFKTGPLGRLLLGAGEGGYESVERMDDAWHLHAFDRAMLERIASPYFVIDEVVAIPTPVTPIRFAARLRPR